MIAHPREEMLLAFQDHRLDDGRRRRLAGHLSGCQRCRNVVQAHRAVRGVFALEAPFAPDGVLERVLASRATGMMVLLPVAEPDPVRRIPLPSRGFLIAAGLLLMLGVGVQVLPVSQFMQVFGALGAVVDSWDGPFGGLTLSYPEPPVAKGARLDPSRMRPMRARYRISTIVGREAPRGSTMDLEVTRVPSGWQLRSTWRNHPGQAVKHWANALVSDSLALMSWESAYNTGADLENSHHYQFMLRSDSFTESYRYIPAPGRAHPPSRVPYDSAYLHALPERTPLAVGDGHVYALLATAPLRQGWVGAFLDIRIGSNRYAMQFPPTTLMTAGSDSVTTPLGRFDTWELRELDLSPGGNLRIWVRKSDGLVVKSTSGRNGWSTETVLESVTYP